MAVNPNPTNITDEFWWLWEEIDKVIPGVLLGGIYARKKGYHGTRLYNLTFFPGNYSIQLTLDLQGPSNVAAAIDLTMSDTEMRKRTNYLRIAADNNDPRLQHWREFYGTLDSRNVYGRIKDGQFATWRSSSSDLTHLWHIHGSCIRAFVELMAAMTGFLSVISGQSLVEYKTRIGDLMIGTQEGDKGQVVNGVQALLRYTGQTLDGKIITVDGQWGSRTTNYLYLARKYIGSSVALADCKVMTGWAFAQTILALFKFQFHKWFKSASAGLKKEILDSIEAVPPSQQQIEDAVHNYVVGSSTVQAMIREEAIRYINAHEEDFRGPVGPVADEIVVRLKTGDIS